jgi:hypothetical protein
VFGRCHTGRRAKLLAGANVAASGPVAVGSGPSPPPLRACAHREVSRPRPPRPASESLRESESLAWWLRPPRRPGIGSAAARGRRDAARPGAGLAEEASSPHSSSASVAPPPASLAPLASASLGGRRARAAGAPPSGCRLGVNTRRRWSRTPGPPTAGGRVGPSAGCGECRPAAPHPAVAAAAGLPPLASRRRRAESAASAGAGGGSGQRRGRRGTSTGGSSAAGAGVARGRGANGRPQPGQPPGRRTGAAGGQNRCGLSRPPPQGLGTTTTLKGPRAAAAASAAFRRRRRHRAAPRLPHTGGTPRRRNEGDEQGRGGGGGRGGHCLPAGGFRGCTTTGGAAAAHRRHRWRWPGRTRQQPAGPPGTDALPATKSDRRADTLAAPAKVP